MKRPYRLAARATLTPEPPFTPEIVKEMLAAAMVGPKGRSVKHVEPSADAISFLTGTLNHRHAYFHAAQVDRARKDRRDRTAKLIDELRQLMPEIVQDAEQQRLKLDDVCSRGIERAANAMHAFAFSDIPRTALPVIELPENVPGWQWAAPSLHADAAALIGANAAVRFLVAAIPKLTGETPKLSTVHTWLKKQRVILANNKIP
jgi:hypothetical protein